MAGEKMTVATAALVAPAHDEPVGGDFQLIDEGASKTVIVVGDVTGNGADAAPYAERLCGTLRESIRGAEDPAELLEDLNTAICNDRDFDRFVTACALMLDRDQWAASWGFAGHLPPHWLDTGLPVDGAKPGLPLGVDRACGATSAERRPLHWSEGFVLFTDGLEDVRGPGRDRFGTARVIHTLATELRRQTPEVTVRGLKRAACEFGEGELEDDLCIVAVRAT